MPKPTTKFVAGIYHFRASPYDADSEQDKDTVSIIRSKHSAVYTPSRELPAHFHPLYDMTPLAPDEQEIFERIAHISPEDLDTSRITPYSFVFGIVDDWYHRTRLGSMPSVAFQTNTSELTFRIGLSEHVVVDIYVPFWNQGKCSPSAVRAAIQKAYLLTLKGMPKAVMVRPGMVPVSARVYAINSPKISDITGHDYQVYQPLEQHSLSPICFSSPQVKWTEESPTLDETDPSTISEVASLNTSTIEYISDISSTIAPEACTSAMEGNLHDTLATHTGSKPVNRPSLCIRTVNLGVLCAPKLQNSLASASTATDISTPGPRSNPLDEVKYKARPIPVYESAPLVKVLVLLFLRVVLSGKCKEGYTYVHQELFCLFIYIIHSILHHLSAEPPHGRYPFNDWDEWLLGFVIRRQNPANLNIPTWSRHWFHSYFDKYLIITSAYLFAAAIWTLCGLHVRLRAAMTL